MWHPLSPPQSDSPTILSPQSSLKAERQRDFRNHFQQQQKQSKLLQETAMLTFQTWDIFRWGDTKVVLTPTAQWINMNLVKKKITSRDQWKRGKVGKSFKFGFSYILWLSCLQKGQLIQRFWVAALFHWELRTSQVPQYVVSHIDQIALEPSNKRRQYL